MTASGTDSALNKADSKTTKKKTSAPGTAFTYKDNRVLGFDAYSVALPDGFSYSEGYKLLTGSGEETVDFVAWTPDTITTDKWETGRITVNTVPAARENGCAISAAFDVFKEDVESAPDLKNNSKEIDHYKEDDGQFLYGYIRQKINGKRTAFHCLVGSEGRLYRFRICFNTGVSLEKMERTVTEWLRKLEIKPVAEKQETETVSEPVVEKPETETVPEPVVEKPETETVSEPVVEATVHETVPESVIKEPVPENIAEPETIPEPVVEETVPETVQEEPAPEPVIDPVQLALEEKNKELAAVDAAAEDSRGKRDEAARQLEEAERSYSKLLSDQLIEEESTKLQIRSLEAKSAEIENVISELKHRRREARTQREENKKKIGNLEPERRARSHEIAMERKALEDKLNILADEKAEIQEEKADKKSKLQAVFLFKKKKQQEYDEVKSRLKAKNSEISACDEELEGLDARVAELKESTNKERARLNQEIARLDLEEKELRKSIAVEEESIKKISKDVSVLEEKIKNYKLSIANAANALADCKKQYEAYDESVKMYETQRERILREIEQLEKGDGQGLV